MKLGKRKRKGPAASSSQAFDQNQALIKLDGGTDRLGWEFRWQSGTVTQGLAAALKHIEENPEEAKHHLEQGHFVSWYSLQVVAEEDLDTLRSTITKRLSGSEDEDEQTRRCRPIDFSTLKRTSDLRPRRSLATNNITLNGRDSTFSLSEMAFIIKTLRAEGSTATSDNRQPESSPVQRVAAPVPAMRSMWDTPQNREMIEEQWDHDSCNNGVASSGKRKANLTQRALAFSTLAMMVTFGYGVIRLSGGSTESPKVASFPAPQQETPQEEERSTEDLIREAEEVARRFLAAETKEEFLKYVRNPRLTRMQLTKSYEERTFTKLGQPGALEVKSLANLEDKQMLLFAASRNGSAQSIHLCLVDEGKGFQVDWQAFVGYSERSWTDIVSQRPENEILVRSLCRKDNYYSLAYQETNWQCYSLQHPNEDETLFAYVEKGSDLESQLDEMLSSSVSNGLDMFTATVRIRCHPDSGRNQVQVSEVIGKGWIN